MAFSIKYAIIIIILVIGGGASIFLTIGSFDDSISLIVDSDKEKSLLVETKKASWADSEQKTIEFHFF